MEIAHIGWCPAPRGQDLRGLLAFIAEHLALEAWVGSWLDFDG